VTHRGPFQPLPFCDSVWGQSRGGDGEIGSVESAWTGLLGKNNNELGEN